MVGERKPNEPFTSSRSPLRSPRSLSSLSVMGNCATQASQVGIRVPALVARHMHSTSAVSPAGKEGKW
jgi:hypothetical protein